MVAFKQPFIQPNLNVSETFPVPWVYLDFSLTKARGKGQCDSEAVCENPQSQNVSIHQILDSYLTK